MKKLKFVLLICLFVFISLLLGNIPHFIIILLVLIFKRKKNNIMEQDKIYEIISEEISSNNKVIATWTKAKGESNGNHAVAESLYIQYRFKKLNEEFNSNSKSYSKGDENLDDSFSYNNDKFYNQSSSNEETQPDSTKFHGFLLVFAILLPIGLIMNFLVLIANAFDLFSTIEYHYPKMIYKIEIYKNIYLLILIGVLIWSISLLIIFYRKKMIFREVYPASLLFINLIIFIFYIIYLKYLSEIFSIDFSNQYFEKLFHNPILYITIIWQIILCVYIYNSKTSRSVFVD